MSEDFDPYAVLGVADSATREEVREAYRALAAKYHPDRDVGPGATELMSSINRAWQILGDGARRRVFDAERAARQPANQWSPVDDTLADGLHTQTLGGLRPVLVATMFVMCVVLVVLVLIAMSQSGVRG